MKFQCSEFESENDVAKAASGGNPQALEILALAEELGFTSSPPALRGPRARELWKKASDLGSPVAALSLGYMLEHGIGGKRDLQLAQTLFKKAKAGGFVRKQDLRVVGSGASPFGNLTKILIIDGSDLDYSKLSDLLSSGGCEVHHAKQGKAAFELLANHPGIKLIFTELNLQIMNGLQFLKRLRSSDYASIPVVVYSSDASKENVAAVKGARVSGWLLKPASKDKLNELMKLLTDSRKAS
jgi:CheY-like chemotaxis protein